MDILTQLKNEFDIKQFHVENIVKLIDEGNTIPFIARYRKELTGSLDDQVLREFSNRLVYIRNLNEKRELVRTVIVEQQKMTEEINKSLNEATTLTLIDDIYRPFKPKRRTKATIAKEKGLETLATAIFEQKEDINILAKKYISEEVESVEEAINGALDIVAEFISDNAVYRGIIREKTKNNGLIISKAKDDKATSSYEIYYDYSELIKKIPNHRILAINRGEKEKFLKVKVEVEVDYMIDFLRKYIIKNTKLENKYIKIAIENSYKKLIAPSIEREIRNMLTEKAEISSIEIFSKNLKQLLLQPPLKNKNVLALDPGFRTGCKFAIVDKIGKVLDTGVIYPTMPQNKIEESKSKLIPLIKKYNVDIIAIGNGTASRETENFVSNMIKEIDTQLFYIIVNESGASVYSASKLASIEFPEYDVSIRSAVSIARRLQDPLAELVKIDSKSIGVGQYQHDMNQKLLSDSLDGVVENCVNMVGVDLNTASPSLLMYVSGITPTISKNIFKYKEDNGEFKTRKDLLKVEKLGNKAYEQCAGFLKITNGLNILDSTSIHPERYEDVEKLLKETNSSIKNIDVKSVDIEALAKKINIGIPTLKDIIKELEKPNRDPRDDFEERILHSEVLSIKDLKDGMILKGTVRNIIDFGAFVDIGVHQDGLVHISEMTNKFINHPFEVVSVGDIVTVKVISIDQNKNRISLTMKI